MSVLIKGMEMPKNCVECPFEKFIFDELWYECPLLDGKTVNSVRDSGRLPDCPLVAVSLGTV